MEFWYAICILSGPHLSAEVYTQKDSLLLRLRAILDKLTGGSAEIPTAGHNNK